MIRTPNSLRQNYFKRKKKRQRDQRSVRKHQTQLPATNSKPTKTPATQTQANTRIIPKSISVTIHYVDSLGRQLLPSVTVKGPYETTLTIPWETVPSYILVSIHHFQKTFLPNPHGIYLIYAKQTAAPVVVYHRDTQGKLLSPPEFLRGNLNSDYTVKPLSGMQQFTQSIQPISEGTFGKETTQINITYETMQLFPLEIKPHTYVRLLQATTVFSQPDTTQPLEKPLPKQSIWRVYQGMKEKTNQRVWFNLGGFIWIIAQNIQVVDDYQPKLLVPPHTSASLEVKSDLPIQQQAVVHTYRKEALSTWDTPYGQTLDYKLYPEEVVFVTHQLQLADTSLWAQLDNGAFVESKYLSFL